MTLDAERILDTTLPLNPLHSKVSNDEIIIYNTRTHAMQYYEVHIHNRHISTHVPIVQREKITVTIVITSSQSPLKLR